MWSLIPQAKVLVFLLEFLMRHPLFLMRHPLMIQLPLLPITRFGPLLDPFFFVVRFLLWRSCNDLRLIFWCNQQNYVGDFSFFKGRR